MYKKSFATFTKKECSGGSTIGRILQNVALSVQEEFEQTLLPTRPKRIIVIAGPTGVGKTALSLKLAGLLGGEVISADCMQVYRGMDIGTAKPTVAERARVPHHLVDVRDVGQPFNVKDFYEEAKIACQDILVRGRVPMVVGGTGFYIHSFLYGAPAGPPCDPKLRQRLECEEERFGLEFLFEKLKEQDPLYAASITKNDRHKILRGLEIIALSGKKVTDFPWKNRTLVPFFDFRLWFVYMPRSILYKRLEARCDEMLDQGLLEEVVALDRAGIRDNSTASRAIGYRQSLDFLATAKTKQDYEVFVQKLKQASRHLARRQFTWFRQEKNFRCLNLAERTPDEVASIIARDYESEGPQILLPSPQDLGE